MKSNKYAVGEEWMIVDEETQQWVNGTITEVGDDTVCIKWDDLPEDTEYQICDMPRIFHSNANRVVNHPLFEQFSKLLKAYPDDAKNSLSELTGWQTWEDWKKDIIETLKIPMFDEQDEMEDYDVGYNTAAIYAISIIEESIQHLPLLPNTVGDGHSLEELYKEAECWAKNYMHVNGTIDEFGLFKAYAAGMAIIINTYNIQLPAPNQNKIV